MQEFCFTNNGVCGEERWQLEKVVDTREEVTSQEVPKKLNRGLTTEILS